MSNRSVDFMISELSTEDIEKLLIFVHDNILPLVNDERISETLLNVKRSIIDQKIDEKLSYFYENITFNSNIDGKWQESDVTLVRLVWNMQIYVSYLIKEGLRQDWRLVSVISLASSILKTTSEELFNDFILSIIESEILSDPIDVCKDDETK